MNGRVAILIAVVFGSACVRVTAPPTPESARIVVVLPVPAAMAYRRTAQAFLDESLVLERGSAAEGEVVSAPVLLPSIPERPSVIYRAAVIDVGDTSRVLLTGAIRRTQPGAISGVAGTEYPLHSQMGNKAFREAWARLERIAGRLRASDSR